MSERWKDLERHTADTLGGRRVVEDWRLFHERPDVVVPLADGRRLIIDCKAYKRFSHHALIENCRAKYCDGDDVPCLVSKHSGQRGAFITLPLDFVGKLLTAAMPQGSNTYEAHDC